MPLGGSAGVANLQAATIAYLRVGDAPAGSMNYVSLPNNTIEIKAGWRVLTAAEQSSGRFHTTLVRYHQQPSPSSFCYREAVWGLVALHIIQKTPSAPYFIYATFEQADNILTAHGTPVEDENGAVAALPPCRADQPAPCPTTPSLVFNDTGNNNRPSQVPPNVTRSPATYAILPAGQPHLLPQPPARGAACRWPDLRQLPLQFDPTDHRRRQSARACGDRRLQSGEQRPQFPLALLQAGQRPVSADRQCGARPLSGQRSRHRHEPAELLSRQHHGGDQPSAADVQRQPGARQSGTGSNSEYQIQFNPNGTGTHRNVYYGGVGHNMGGCMGCHGAQGQAAGGDFSVILARGQVTLPEGLPQPPPVRLRAARNRPRAP